MIVNAWSNDEAKLARTSTGQQKGKREREREEFFIPSRMLFLHAVKDPARLLLPLV
jgi:hypothetical protein